MLIKKQILKKILITVLIFQFWFTGFHLEIFAQEEPTETPSVVSPTPTSFEEATPTPTLEPTPTIEATPTPIPTENPPLIDSGSLSPNEPFPTISERETFADSSAEIKESIKVMPLSKKNFRAGEKITLVVANTLSSNVEVSVFNVDGVEVNVEKELVSDWGPTVIRIFPPSQFKAGRYRVKVVDPEGNVTTQDFTWGVLAINTNKSIYLPNETAKLAMAVLDERGLMVCDATVKLEIKNPKSEIHELTTQNGEIKVNPDCEVKDYTENPDYAALYTVGEAGVYQMSLTAETKNGIYSIADSFEVREEVAFDVERIATTRVFPPVTYPVAFDIVAGQDFEGQVKEVIPASFAVTQLEGVQSFETSEVLSAYTEVLEEPIFGLVPPFDQAHPISLGFGEQLRDTVLAQKYSDFGLIGHDGVDFDMPEGTPVLSVDDGEVVRVAPNGDYGATVVIQHSWGKSYYGHLSEITTYEGKKIEKGYPLGLSGSTGLSTAPHLHLGVKPNNNDPDNGYYGKINPLPYLNIVNGNQNVLGISAETTPELDSSPSSGVQIITWNVSVKKGERIKLGYNFQAPNISPQFFLLGPLEFKNKEGVIVFQEARRWQLAIDASGTNSVSPTSGATSDTGRTYTFTFTATETMDSGGFTITVPSSGSPDWSAPQGTGGTAGYTTAVGNGNATVATVFSAFNSATGWTEEGGTDACVTGPSADGTTLKEGTASISCDNSTSGNAVDNNDGIGFTFVSQDWSSYSQIGFWARSDDGDGAGDLSMWLDETAGDCQNTTIQETDLSALTADTWIFQKIALTGTRTDVETFCILSGGATAQDNDHYWVDEALLGPSVPTFSSRDIIVRILDAAATESFTVIYGDPAGGAGSTVTNSSTVGIHTFTTTSKIAVDGTYTDISAQPTVELCVGGCGPTMDQVMRHGKWFSSGTEQPFTF